MSQQSTNSQNTPVSSPRRDHHLEVDIDRRGANAVESIDPSSGAKRPSSVTGIPRSALRPARVNFHLSDTTSTDEARAPKRPQSLPTIEIPELAEPSDSSPDPEWSERTSAAAQKARNAADRLYSDLSRNNSLEDLSNTTTKELLSHSPGLLTPPPAAAKTSYFPWTTTKKQQPQRQSPKPHSSPPLRPIDLNSVKLDDIPLTSAKGGSRPYDINEDTDEETDVEDLKPLERVPNSQHIKEARRLVRTLTGRHHYHSLDNNRDGTRTPAADKHLHDLEYVPAPDQYKPGILGAILTSRLHEVQRTGEKKKDFYKDHDTHGQTGSDQSRQADHSGRSLSYDSSAGSSGRATPSRKKRWYDKDVEDRASAIGSLLAQSGLAQAMPGAPGGSIPGTPRSAGLRPNFSRSRSSDMISSAVDIIKSGASSIRGSGRARRSPPDDTDVIYQVADIIARREYLKKLCRMFMRYGAPTHRIEEYLRTSARALYVNANFMYMPGAVLCTFVDDATYSTNVELIREAPGLDFGRLKDVFDVYKCVIHNKYTAEEAGDELEAIEKSRNRYTTLLRIFIFGLAAVCVGPFAFSARPIDFGPIFCLGCVLGILQLVVVPRSEQFSHVFEVTAAVLTAFIARGLGSIEHNGEPIFCFSAMAQSSIALILPGYIVLNAALELQSRNMVSGSVRMVYAIIYTLFLGFGLLVGTVLYGLVDRNATTIVTCGAVPYWAPSATDPSIIFVKFIWVPLFACCLALINQARLKQLPAMAVVAICGYQANYWVSIRLASNLQVANAIGAFVIGCVSHLYSRLFHGLAAAAMLPAIFVQVPSGLAASGSLVAGINSSQLISNSNSSAVAIINNGTQGFLNAQDDPNSVYGGTIFNVGYGMVQVAIGISVGLYLSALLVYPYGKRKSGLFSF
jgi:uncharacterized membrane protein YjjP (DUF1212 family)